MFNKAHIIVHTPAWLFIPNTSTLDCSKNIQYLRTIVGKIIYLDESLYRQKLQHTYRNKLEVDRAVRVIHNGARLANARSAILHLETHPCLSS